MNPTLVSDNKQWSYITVWRGCAALCVCVGHMIQIFCQFQQPWLRVFGGVIAQSSVMIFFVVSGYSIAASLHRCHQSKSPAADFFWRRFFRIYPPLIFSLLLCYLVHLIVPYLFEGGGLDYQDAPDLARKGYYFVFEDYLKSIFFLNGFFSNTPSVNGPLWSLSYEIWLYLIYFLFASCFYSKRFYLSIVGFFILYVLMRNDATKVTFFSYASVWFLGTFAYHARTFFVETHADFFPVELIVILCIFSFYLFEVFSYADAPRAYRGVVHQNLLISMVFAWTLFKRFSFSMPSENIGSFFAKFGYTLYLIHFPLMLVFFGYWQDFCSKSLWNGLLIGFASLFFSVFLSFILSPVLENRKLYFKYFLKRT